jgi:nucleoside phosphorylase
LLGHPGEEFLVLETGIGAGATEQALWWLWNLNGANRGLRPRGILAVGFAGALSPALLVGDLLWASEVIDQAGNRWRTTWPGASFVDPDLGWHYGRLLTADALVGDPAAKQRLAAEHGAIAVDMESATIARMCAEQGVLFGCLRAVSDGSATHLSPELVGLLQGGRPSPWRVLTAVLRRPGLVGELRRLARNTRCAARQLARGIRPLLRSLPPSRPG